MEHLVWYRLLSVILLEVGVVGVVELMMEIMGMMEMVVSNFRDCGFASLYCSFPSPNLVTNGLTHDYHAVDLMMDQAQTMVCLETSEILVVGEVVVESPLQ